MYKSWYTPKKSPKTLAKHRRIMLGLAISGALLEPGQVRSQKELARFCDVSHKVIQDAEKSALEKLRRHPLVREIMETI